MYYKVKQVQRALRLSGTLWVWECVCVCVCVWVRVCVCVCVCVCPWEKSYLRQIFTSGNLNHPCPSHIFHRILWGNITFDLVSLCLCTIYSYKSSTLLKGKGKESHSSHIFNLQAKQLLSYNSQNEIVLQKAVVYFRRSASPRWKILISDDVIAQWFSNSVQRPPPPPPRGAVKTLPRSLRFLALRKPRQTAIYRYYLWKYAKVDLIKKGLFHS